MSVSLREWMSDNLSFVFSSKKQGENDVQGHLFLTKPLPGMGRKVNNTYDKFYQIYFTHPKGREEWKWMTINQINRTF